MKNGLGVKECPICKKDLFSGIRAGCKMCGMILEEEDEIFCCEKCREIYDEIHLGIDERR